MPPRSSPGSALLILHAQPLRGTRAHGGGASVQRHVLAPPDTHAELQPVEPIQPPHPLAVDRPAFAAQQHPDPQMSEPRPRVGELPDPQPQRGLIPRPTAAIPGRPTELRQPTGPRTADLERPLKPSDQLSTARGPQAFFRSASASMCLSSVRSATSRFSRLFSSSSCRRRRSSLTPKCAYFFFHV